ncbi:DNA primase [Candidatus Peregrinibacteria bacterium]|nr:DNA primase [Candidatus Peregrinibacteria bacterium]
MSVVDEIKDRLPIEDLVSQYVQLKKAGRSLKGLCPFHQEKSPSFVVSPERGIAYCFGCNKGGDVFKFIQEIEGIDFGDALKLLAEKTGVKLENYAHEKPVAKDQKEMMFEIHEIAAAEYEKQLWTTVDGEKVLQYLRGRGLLDENIKKFRVGFAPDKYDFLYPGLLEKGYNKKLLVASGMALTQDTTVEKIYDRFRGRLMFPILDSFGRVVAFGGRALKREQEPKYLNSPETPIYHKSKILYGFFQAKNFIKNAKEAMLVEGYMDLIMSHQAGVSIAVATSGTALTPKHLRILKPFIEKLSLCFDMDLAGQEAAKRAYALAQEIDVTVNVVTLPEGKDPADYAKAHGEELRKVVEGGAIYTDYFYAKLLRDYGTTGIQAKKKILLEFLPFFAGLPSSVEKDEYVRRLATDLDLKESQIYDEIKNFKLPANHPARRHAAIGNASNIASRFTKILTSEEELVGYLFAYHDKVPSLFLKIEESIFSDRWKPLYTAISRHYNGDRVEVLMNFQEVPETIKEEAQVLSLYVLEKYGEKDESALNKEVEILIKNIKDDSRKQRRLQLHRKLMIAEKNGNQEVYNQTMQDLNNL